MKKKILIVNGKKFDLCVLKWKIGRLKIKCIWIYRTHWTMYLALRLDIIGDLCMHKNMFAVRIKFMNFIISVLERIDSQMAMSDMSKYSRSKVIYTQMNMSLHNL